MNKTPIYIQKIELINFESHKHTVLDGFSKGFNCITGVSNSGKTAVLRALNLCAYNEFNPESIRLGETFCDVTVTSNVGSVNVKRGKGINIWTVTRHGNPIPMVFDKVGRNAVEEACSVLGMRMIKLGDNEVPVNVMNQLEPHFLIAGVGDEKTSGSGRAEIIDEICGLHGAEELIKDISLDAYRLGRIVSESELRIQDLQGRLHSEHCISVDLVKKDKIEKLESNIKTCEGNKVYVEGLVSAFVEDKYKLDEVEDKISQITIPDTSLINVCKQQVDDLSKIQSLYSEIKTVNDKIETNKNTSGKIVEITIDQEIKTILNKVKSFSALQTEHKTTTSKLAEIKLQSQDKVDLDNSKIEEVRTCVKKLSNLKGLYGQELNLRQKTKEIQTKLSELDLEAVETEMKELYKGLDICPVTKKVIGETCSLWELKNENI
jgi:exonuclease SbcC